MNLAKGSNQKFLVLTCDSEAVPAFAAEKHVDRLIWGKMPEAPYEVGIGKMMDVADQFGVKMVFFHDVLEEHRYGKETGRAARYIIDRGHDLQLHMHAEFLPPEFWARIGRQPPTWSMNFYDTETAFQVMDYGVKLFEKMAGYKPLAYRSGAFRYNAWTLKALQTCEIPLSFQYYPASALKASHPHGFDAGILPVFKWSNGIVEVPLGMHEYSHPRKEGFRYRAFDLNQLTGGLEQAQATMQRFWQNGPGFSVCVMLLHSWSFLQKNGSSHLVWKDDSLIKLFTNFLQSLPPDVQVITATELLRKISQQQIKPAFELPIQVAGTDGVPLLSLSAPRPAGKAELPTSEMSTAPKSSKPAAVETESPAGSKKQIAEAIRLHDEERREARRHLVESFPYPTLDEAHLHGTQLLVSRYHLLDKLPKHGTVCEIGVAHGDFSAHILERCKPAKLHLVDLWDSDRYSSGRQQVLARFADPIKKGLVSVHIGSSTEKLTEFPDHTFDWVYIDTVHDYKVTAEELLLSRAKVKPGGIIAGHDYTPGNIVTPVCYGVVQAVQEFCVKYGWKYLFLTCESHCYASFAIQAIDPSAK